MDILAYNVPWMAWNIILAVLPVLFAYAYFQTTRTLYKVVLGILWFLFFPNSLYIISDMEHIIWEWPMVASVERVLLILQFIHLQIIGLFAFICGMYAFEKELRRFLGKHRRTYVSVGIISMNFLIGFAMVMGKVERVNSWEVFSDTENVIRAAFNVLGSDILVLVSILFGLFGIFFYFLFRDSVVSWLHPYLKAKRLTNAQ